MRALSLASRFLITLVVSAVLPLLLYGWFSLRGMRDQIDEQVVRVFLPQLAADYAQKIETRLERTDQACAIVRELARRVLDTPPDRLDEELEAFGEQVELIPDLLSEFLDLLLLADADGKVLFWQDGRRLDPSVHQRRASLMPSEVGEEAWFREAQGERGVHFLPWGRSPYLHRGMQHRSMDPGSHHLGVAMDVPMGDGHAGVLFALIRWSEVQAVIDEARQVLIDEAGLPSAQVFVVGRDGVVQAHTDRGRYGLSLEPPALAQRLSGADELGRCESLGAQGGSWRVGYAPGGGVGAAEGAAIAIDQKSMARVFVNLVQNAIEAAPDGVRVEIRSRLEAGEVVVEVFDDGPGVPEELREKLFDPYFTTKSSGTGLGLAICRRLVEAHGGKIRLESTHPGATRFVLALPVA